MDDSLPAASPTPVGLSAERLQTLVDGVLAILLTLLVLELRAPEVRTPDPTALWAALRPLWPKFLSFLISFGVLSVFWFGHRMEYHYVRRTDRLLIWLTLLWLLTLSVVPFAAALLGNNPRNPIALAAYGLNMVAAGLTRWAHWHYTTDGRRLIDDELPAAAIQAIGRRFLLVPLLYVPVVALGWWQPSWALWLLAGLPVLYIPAPRQDAHLTSLPSTRN